VWCNTPLPASAIFYFLEADVLFALFLFSFQVLGLRDFPPYFHYYFNGFFGSLANFFGSLNRFIPFSATFPSK
jgi:hypothetical protein